MPLHHSVSRTTIVLIIMCLPPTYLISVRGQAISAAGRECPKILWSSIGQRAYLGENRVSYLAERADVVVVGRIVEVKNASDGQQGSVNESSNPKPDEHLVFTIKVGDVLKGNKRVGRTSTVMAMAIPEPGDVKIHPIALQAEREYLLKESGGNLQEVQLKLFSQELTTTEQFIFFLKAADTLRHERGSQPQHTLMALYHYINAVKAEPKTVELIKGYLQLAETGDIEQRERGLIKRAFLLLRDPQTPERLAKDALDDLCYLKVRSAAKQLSDREVEEIIQIIADVERPDSIRSGASTVVGGLIASGRRIDPGPLLKMLENSSDTVDRRVGVVYLLEKMNTLEIRRGVAEILAKDPQTMEDKLVWQSLAKSFLAK